MADLERVYALALAALQQGALETAERHFKSVLAARPRDIGALNLLGIVLIRSGQFDEAERCIRKAIRAGSGSDPATLTNYGTALRALGRSAEALARFDEALALNPQDAEACNSRGMALGDLARYDEAVASFERAIALRPDFFVAHYNLGNVLSQLKHYERALTACDRALALNPNFSLAWYGRSQALKADGKAREALEAFQRYLAMATPRDNPHYQDFVTLGAKVFAYDLSPSIYVDEAEIAAERARLETLLGEIEAKVDAMAGAFEGRLPATFMNAVFSVSGFYIAYQQRNDVALSRRYASVLQKMLRIRDEASRQGGRSSKIRFGIVSGHLKNHNGARWAYDWLSQLPQADYSFFIYALNPDLDEVSQKFAALGRFRQMPFGEATFERAVATMRDDHLDVLMFPDVGMNAASRVLAQFRIAPIQFSAWGHPVTTGSPNVDYYLSSDLMEPADAQAHYSETLIPLPNLALYLKPGAQPVDDNLPFALPKDRVLYGCLQSLFKYLPQFDVVFARIAARVPDACFLLIEGSPASQTTTFRDRLCAAFEREGLDFEHFVRFLPRMSAGQFCGLLKRIDVNIDSIGWSGGNSTVQSLEADCPLVTLPTEFMRGRHSYAMLKLIGVEELIAGSLEDFVDTLVRLGTDGDFRAAMESKISQNKHRLYEDKTFIAALDRFLKSEHARLQRRV